MGTRACIPLVTVPTDDGGGKTCAMDAGGNAVAGALIADMALSIASSASNLSRWVTDALAWIMYGMASDGLVTTPMDDLTP